jgi:DNA repair exonuclease SbcCD nuclease subunit
MKFIACADLHLTASQPKFRIDNYFESLFDKLQFIVDTANDFDVDILIAGDIFDSSKVGYKVTNTALDVFGTCKNNIYTVPGQHDMLYHSGDMQYSPLGNLGKHKALHILNNTKVPQKPLYGVGWQGFISADIDPQAEVVLVHHTITAGEPPFFLKDALSSEDVMDKYFPKAKIIISGDYHAPHMRYEKERNLINCGSMCRSNRDQIHHEPSIYFVDSATSYIQRILIPVKPVEEVFDLDKIARLKEKKLHVEADDFIKAIVTGVHQHTNFKEITLRVGKEANINKKTRLEIGEMFLEAGE